MSKLLERLDKLEKAAVPGPWEADKSGIVFDDDGISICTCKDRGDGNPNARLIAELRNAYPKLRAVVEAAMECAEGSDFEFTFKLQEALAAQEE